MRKVIAQDNFAKGLLAIVSVGYIGYVFIKWVSTNLVGIVN
jgi:hypothetical protein